MSVETSMLHCSMMLRLNNSNFFIHLVCFEHLYHCFQVIFVKFAQIMTLPATVALRPSACLQEERKRQHLN